jgi:hypothetical protein
MSDLVRVLMNSAARLTRLNSQEGRRYIWKMTKKLKKTARKKVIGQIQNPVAPAFIS